MKRPYLTICFALIAFVLVNRTAAHADIVNDINLPGIGSQIPILSYSFPTANSLSFTKDIDMFSPLLFDATATGTTFPVGSLDTYDTLFSTTTPITSFVMTDILISSIQFSGSNNNPFETVTLNFQTGTLVSNVPEPSSFMLLGSGMAGIIGVVRRRLKR